MTIEESTTILFYSKTWSITDRHGGGGTRRMIAWLQELSPFTLAIVCSGAFVLFTWFGIIFLRPFLRLPLRRQPGANDLVSYTSSWFSLLYGLLLGLLSVATYQNAAQIQTFVQREAGALALLYRGSTAYPEPLRSELQYLLRDYTLYVDQQGLAGPPRGADPAGRCGPHGRARPDAGDVRADYEGAGDRRSQQTFANLDALAEARIERISGVSLDHTGRVLVRGPDRRPDQHRPHLDARHAGSSPI